MGMAWMGEDLNEFQDFGWAYFILTDLFSLHLPWTKYNLHMHTYFNGFQYGLPPLPDEKRQPQVAMRRLHR